MFFLELFFHHFFDQKIEFFKMHLRGARPTKYCNLQIKMHIFKKRIKNETQKNHQKNDPKKHQKKALDPSKWSSRRDETLGFEKSRFLQKKKKIKKENQQLSYFYVDACGPKPCIL